MSYQISPVVEELIRNRMASGRYASTDELLIEALQSLDAEEAELRAIQEALDSFDHGEKGVPLDEAFEKLQNHHRP